MTKTENEIMLKLLHEAIRELEQHITVGAPDTQFEDDGARIDNIRAYDILTSARKIEKYFFQNTKNKY